MYYVAQTVLLPLEEAAIFRMCGFASARTA
jgi:hypothetical protein